MENMLVRYVRDERRKHSPKFGTIIGIKTTDNSVAIGFAVCSRRDNFIKNIGKDISKSRAEKWANYTNYLVIGPNESICEFKTKKQAMDRIEYKTNCVMIDESLYKEVKHFIQRCKKYFKNCSLPKWTETIN